MVPWLSVFANNRGFGSAQKELISKKKTIPYWVSITITSFFFHADLIAMLNIIPIDRSHLRTELFNSRSPAIHPLDFGFWDLKKTREALGWSIAPNIILQSEESRHFDWENGKMYFILYQSIFLSNQLSIMLWLISRVNYLLKRPRWASWIEARFRQTLLSSYLC